MDRAIRPPEEITCGPRHLEDVHGAFPIACHILPTDCYANSGLGIGESVCGCKRMSGHIWKFGGGTIYGFEPKVACRNG